MTNTKDHTMPDHTPSLSISCAEALKKADRKLTDAHWSRQVMTSTSPLVHDDSSGRVYFGDYGVCRCASAEAADRVVRAAMGYTHDQVLAVLQPLESASDAEREAAILSLPSMP